MNSFELAHKCLIEKCGLFAFNLLWLSTFESRQMNFSVLGVRLSGVIVASRLINSPRFSCPLMYSIAKSHFSRFSSSIFSGNLSPISPITLYAKSSVFSSLLSPAVRISSNYMYIWQTFTSTIQYTASGSASFLECVIANSTTSVALSAGIYVSCTSFSISVISCSFITCTQGSTSDGAAALYFFAASSTTICRCCFYKCSSQTLGNSYGVRSDSGSIVSCDMNSTTELSPGLSSIHCSFAGGSSHFCFSNNNASSITVSTGSGFCLLYCPSGVTIASYSQSANSSGYQILRLNLDSTAPYITTINFINLTTTEFMFKSAGDEPIIKNCVFANNNFGKSVDGGSTFSFVSCVFSQSSADMVITGCVYDSGCSFSAVNPATNAFSAIGLIACNKIKSKIFTCGALGGYFIFAPLAASFFVFEQ